MSGQEQSGTAADAGRQSGKQPRSIGTGRRTGFALIELLVVIAIIAIFCRP